MAELNRDSLITIAATTTLTLTTSRKLIRNFRYYKSADKEIITRKELAVLCKKTRMDVFGMANIIAKNDHEMNPFLVSLAGRIYDQLEELHRKILFFDPDHISEIIPLIDKQRKYWSKSMDHTFYNQKLQDNLENKISSQLLGIERMVAKLPVSVTTN